MAVEQVQAEDTREEQYRLVQDKVMVEQEGNIEVEQLEVQQEGMEGQGKGMLEVLEEVEFHQEIMGELDREHSHPLEGIRQIMLRQATFQALLQVILEIRQARMLIQLRVPYQDILVEALELVQGEEQEFQTTPEAKEQQVQGE